MNLEAQGAEISTNKSPNACANLPRLPSGNDNSGTTPVSPDEERWLIPSVITLAQLNLLERENILEARRWLFGPRRKLTPDDLLDYLFIRELHRRMFRRVWRWAEKTRDNEVNLGVPALQNHSTTSDSLRRCPSMD